jgi:hypothetical protein
MPDEAIEHLEMMMELDREALAKRKGVPLSTILAENYEARRHEQAFRKIYLRTIGVSDDDQDVGC